MFDEKALIITFHKHFLKKSKTIGIYNTNVKWETTDNINNKEITIVEKNKFVEMNKKIAAGVTEGYKKIEYGVVSGYKKIEDGVVTGFNKIADNFADKFLTKDGESVEAAKKRVTEDLFDK